MKKVIHEILATGTVVEDKEKGFKVLATISKETEVKEGSSEESGAAASTLHVVLKMKSDDFGEIPAAPITFEDIKEMVEKAGGKMAVHKLNSKDETVAIPTPMLVKYAKTKAFERTVKDKESGEDVTKSFVRAEIRFIEL